MSSASTQRGTVVLDNQSTNSPIAPVDSNTLPPPGPGNAPGDTAGAPRTGLTRLLPTPLGWIGVGGLGASSAVGMLGLTLSAVGSANVFLGQREQDAYDHARTTGPLANEQRSTHLDSARAAYDRARLLFAFSAITLVAALVGMLASGIVIIVDDTFVAPGRKARHPLWHIFGPAAGVREPAPAWPNWPVPDVKGVFVPPDAPPPPDAAPPHVTGRAKPPTEESQATPDDETLPNGDDDVTPEKRKPGLKQSQDDR